MECVTHQVDRFAQNPRECLKDLDRLAEIGYQSPVAIAIFFEIVLPTLEQLEDSLRRI